VAAVVVSPLRGHYIRLRPSYWLRRRDQFQLEPRCPPPLGCPFFSRGCSRGICLAEDALLLRSPRKNPLLLTDRATDDICPKLRALRLILNLLSGVGVASTHARDPELRINAAAASGGSKGGGGIAQGPKSSPSGRGLAQCRRWSSPPSSSSSSLPFLLFLVSERKTRLLALSLSHARTRGQLTTSLGNVGQNVRACGHAISP